MRLKARLEKLEPAAVDRWRDTWQAYIAAKHAGALTETLLDTIDSAAVKPLLDSGELEVRGLPCTQVGAYHRALQTRCGCGTAVHTRPTPTSPTSPAGLTSYKARRRSRRELLEPHHHSADPVARAAALCFLVLLAEARDQRVRAQGREEQRAGKHQDT